MNLPPDFIRTIQGVFGKKGRVFIQTLPELIAQASGRWGLFEVQPVPNLSYNFVAFAKQRPSPFGTCARKGRGQGEGDVVLKIGVPDRE